MNHIMRLCVAILFSAFLAACGKVVEVPTGHIGKILTQNGLQEGTIPTSKFRLPACWSYCDKLVLLNVSDTAINREYDVFIPEDKLNISVQIRGAVSIHPEKTEELFENLSSEPVSDGASTQLIEWEKIFITYAEPVINKETREYISQFNITQIASNNEKINYELGQRIAANLAKKSPFIVREISIGKVTYPTVITEAQEKAAKRREEIEQEQAMQEVSKVRLERELQEARLQRQIETEKAQTDAAALQLQRQALDDRVLELRKIENQAAWIAKWNGVVPATVLSDDSGALLNISK